MTSNDSSLLVILSGIQNMDPVALSNNVSICGNSSAANINLPNPYISRRHFQIKLDQDVFYISDLGSRNGTTINGKQLEPHSESILRDGDIIGLSSEQVTIRFEEQRKTLVLNNQEYTSGNLSTYPNQNPEDLLIVESHSRKVIVYGQEITGLTKKEFDILECLFTNKGTAVSRDTVAHSGWPERPDDVSESEIDQYIRRIRIKIEPNASRPQIVITKRGFGYIIP